MAPMQKLVKIVRRTSSPVRSKFTHMEKRCLTASVKVCLQLSYLDCLRALHAFNVGKDKSVFVTPEDADKPAMVKELVEEEGYGIILPNGEINWDCPCLGGMAKGTCGQEFKDAFSCFHYR